MAKKDAASKRSAEEIIRAEEADAFEQPYWNLDQYLIWLASRDPAAVLRATDRPNSGTNPPIGWRVYQEPNVDRQKVEKEAVRAIKGGHVKARVRFKGKWFTPDDPRWFGKWFTPDDREDWVIEFEGKPNFAALLMGTTKHGRRKKVRPRFNPQSILQLYRAPTLSNICYRPDDPDVGRFIAYSDVWNWRAECISRQEVLSIDEAGSRAEKIIRDICMNEKLTMWGIDKADRGAELKRVTPQAWQLLSINPLYDRATKGEYGPVIWEGLCFDRKEFVTAFVTGGGNGPPTHTPAPQPTQPRERTSRKQPQRDRARRALVELFPDGSQTSKSDAELVKAVINKCGQPSVSRDSILRAAGRRY